MGAIVQYATGFNISYFYFLVNIVLLAIGMKVLGNKFGVKTIYAIIVTSVMFRILPSAIPQQFIQEVALNNGKLLCAIIAAVMWCSQRENTSMSLTRTICWYSSLNIADFSIADPSSS